MSDTARILLVDDDQELRELLAQTLTEYGFATVAVGGGTDMFRELETGTYDLVLLDIMMPGEDGLTLCRELRVPGTAYSDIPVIFLTARKDLTDRVVGLEIGGDDYLPKPFQARELVARIRALLRRSQVTQTRKNLSSVQEKTQPRPAEKSIWSFGEWKMNVLARHLITRDNVVVSLSAAEYRLLMLFLENPHIVMSRERIVDHVMERNLNVYDRSLDVQISRLRAKLGDRGRNPGLIRTMRGDGYMLAADVVKGTM